MFLQIYHQTEDSIVEDYNALLYKDSQNIDKKSERQH